MITEFEPQVLEPAKWWMINLGFRPYRKSSIIVSPRLHTIINWQQCYPQWSIGTVFCPLVSRFQAQIIFRLFGMWELLFASRCIWIHLARCSGIHLCIHVSHIHFLLYVIFYLQFTVHFYKSLGISFTLIVGMVTYATHFSQPQVPLSPLPFLCFILELSEILFYISYSFFSPF